MADILIDFSIEESPPSEPSSKGSSIKQPLSSTPSSKYSHLLDRINAFRKLGEECYVALEVRHASRLPSSLHRSSLTATQELIEEYEKVTAENKSLKSHLTDTTTSEDTSAVFSLQPEASFQELQIKTLENQLKAARLSMVRQPAT